MREAARSELYKLAAILTLAFTLTLTLVLTLRHLGADMIRSVNMRGAALPMTLLPATFYAMSTHDDVEPEREPEEVLHPESDSPPTPHFLSHFLSAVL